MASSVRVSKLAKVRLLQLELELEVALVETPVWVALQASTVRPALLEVLLEVLQVREMPPALPLATPTRGSFSTTPLSSLSNAKATATRNRTAARFLQYPLQSPVQIEQAPGTTLGQVSNRPYPSKISTRQPKRTQARPQTRPSSSIMFLMDFFLFLLFLVSSAHSCMAGPYILFYRVHNSCQHVKVFNFSLRRLFSLLCSCLGLCSAL